MALFKGIWASTELCVDVGKGSIMAGTVESTPASQKRKRPESGYSSSKKAKSSHGEPASHPNISQLEQQLQDSQRHLNNIVVLQQLARKEVKLAKRSLSATVSLCRVFCRLHADGSLSRGKHDSSRDESIAAWLKERYAEYKSLLVKAMVQARESQQETVLATVMQLVHEEGVNTGAAYLGKDSLFHQCITTILETPKCKPLCKPFVERYAQPYDDLRHHTFIAASEVLDSGSKASPATPTNCFLLMSAINPSSSAEISSLFVEQSLSKKSRKELTFPTHRKQAQRAWMALLNAELTKDQRKTVVGFITHRVVPWIQNVEVLMDFLSDSFDVGGSSSLVALSGLFYLMQEKNLDYPDFYTKLYSLLDGDLLYSKHRSRFFRLLDTFLASTHLPAVMVASFIKRLSRLALRGPPAGIVAVVPWIYNMLKAHPTCTFMIHREPRTDEERQLLEEEGLEDPFDHRERDPMQTGAIDSCLWEIETLQSHYHPNVASLAKIISEQFTKSSYNLEDFLGHSYASLIDNELSRELKKTPVVEFEIPKSIFTTACGDATLQTLLQDVVG